MAFSATRLRALTLVLAGVLAAASLSARASAHDRALVDLLSLIHHDPTPAELSAFGPGLEAKLIAIAEDPSVRSLARVRAVAAQPHRERRSSSSPRTSPPRPPRPGACAWRGCGASNTTSSPGRPPWACCPRC